MFVYADTTQPPRQAAPATPPQEGNGPVLCWCRYDATTPSGCACHPSTGGEWSGTMLVQIRCDHPVRLRLPPLQRRGMVRYYAGADTMRPPRQAAPATPPQEGNGSVLCWCRYDATTPSGCACHPSTGGEWSGTMLVQIRHNHPVRLRLSPLHRRGMVRSYQLQYFFNASLLSLPACNRREKGNFVAIFNRRVIVGILVVDRA